MKFIDTLPKTEEEIELFCILQELVRHKKIPDDAYTPLNKIRDRNILELKVEYFKKLKQLQPETK